MIQMLDTLDSDRESMGSLKALGRERIRRADEAESINGQSHESRFHCILGGHAKRKECTRWVQFQGKCILWLLGIPGRACLCASTVRSSGFEG